MEQSFDENAVFTLIGDDGKPESFEHLLTFMYEDERYMALTPAGSLDVEDPDEDEEIDVVFVRIIKVNGEDALEPVENEVLGDELFEVMCELLGEEDEDEEE